MSEQSHRKKHIRIHSRKFRSDGKKIETVIEDSIETILNIGIDDFFYIGVTSDYKKTYKDHRNDKNTYDMKYMYVLWKTESKKDLVKLECELIKKFWRYIFNKNNIEEGSGVNFKKGNTYYLYMLSKKKVQPML